MSFFICPHCRNPLVKSDRSYLCENNHCFDMAKEGYINLLPVQSKKTRNPGDNDKMIMARRCFLDTGLYRPLVDNIVSLINQTLVEKNHFSVLDLGCGEGYYSGIVSENISGNIDLYALDISKIAVRYASKRYKNVSFCVASAFSIPAADKSLDLIYRIYAPSDDKELVRVLKSGGYLLTVTPGEKHLIELRELIYENVLSHSSKSEENELFKKMATQELNYPMKIDDPGIVQNLLDMTPFGWKIREDALSKLLSRKNWNITCDFVINLYQKY